MNSENAHAVVEMVAIDLLRRLRTQNVTYTTV